MVKGYDSTNRQYGAMRLALTSSNVNFEFINTGGTVKDSGTITCGGSGSTTPTPTPTITRTPTRTGTPTRTPTPTRTLAASLTPTRTPTRTATLPGQPTATRTPTPTRTPTAGAGNTFNPLADSYVVSTSPTSNFGTSKTLYVDNSPIDHSYLQFNVTGLSKAPSNATLKIFANSTSTSGFDVYAVSNNSWTETGITYSNAPAFGSKTGSSGAISSSGKFYSVNVTSLVKGNGTISFGLATTGNTAINLSSRESGANAPQLVITP